MRSNFSCFCFQYHPISLRSSSSCSHLISPVSVTSIFPFLFPPLYAPLLIHTQPTSFHRTTLNEFKRTRNLNLAVLDSSWNFNHRVTEGLKSEPRILYVFWGEKKRFRTFFFTFQASQKLHSSINQLEF